MACIAVAESWLIDLTLLFPLTQARWSHKSVSDKLFVLWPLQDSLVLPWQKKKSLYDCSKKSYPVHIFLLIIGNILARTNDLSQYSALRK